MKDISREEFDSLIKNTDCGVVFIDRNCDFAFCNPASENIFGVSEDGLVGRNLKEFLSLKDFTNIKNRVKSRAVNGSNENEAEIQTESGEKKHIRLISTPKFDKEGNFLGVFSFIFDITRDKQWEKDLLENEQKYRILTKNSPDIIVRYDLDGRLIFASPNIKKISGEEINKHVGKTHKELGHTGEKWGLLEEKIREVINTGKSRELDFLHEEEDTSLYLHWKLVPEFASDGSLCSVLGIARDLSEVVKIKEEITETRDKLWESEKQKKMILNAMSEMVVFQDLDYKVLWMNKAALESLEKDADEVVGHYCFELWADRDNPCDGCPITRALETGEVQTKEVSTAEGRKWRVRATPVVNKEGKATGVLQVARDITETKRMEQALRDSKKLYKTLIDISPYAVTVSDLDGEITYVSERILEMHGYENSEELLGKSALELIAPEDRKKAQDNITKTLEEGTVCDLGYNFLRRDGSTFAAELNASLLRNEEGKPRGFVAITRDITEQKKKEKFLKEREAFNFALFNYNPLETIIVDREGKVIKSNLAKRQSGDKIPDVGDIMYKDYASKHEIDMYGELMECIETGEQKNFPEMKYKDKYLSINIAPFSEGAIIVSQDITERKKAEKELKNSEKRLRLIGKTLPSLLIITNERGDNIYVSPNSEEITGYTNDELESKYISWVHEDDRDKAEALIKEAFKEHTSKRHFEYKAVKKNGSVWFASSSWESVIDDKGKFQGIVLQTMDITDRKIMEREIAKAQKLESIGVLAGGIAHDFNNFLTGIIGNISLAKLHLKSEDEAYDILTESEKAAQSAKSLTQQLLTFSKGGVPIKEKAAIGDLIKGSVKFVLSGSNIKCDFDFQKDLWEVNIDKAQINQVINNIIINASEAMPEGGNIHIKAENIEADEAEKVPLEKGEYVKITIQDTGTGISEKNISRIFDPFFTTKEKGSGLGLSTVFSTVKKHGGFISVDSEVGVGSSFYLYLPAVIEDKSDVKNNEEREGLGGGEGRVLIMDDKDFVRKAAVRALKLFGYKVKGAENGEEAVNLCKEALEEGKPYSLVILDLTIPGGMGGVETLKELRKIDPGIKGVVSSGYSDDPIMSAHEKFGFDAVIKKPYEYKELAKLVKVLLNKN